MNYLEDGIEVIKGVFTKEEAKKIKEEALKLLKNPSAINEAGYKHTPLEKSGQFPAIIFFPALVSPYLESIRTDKRLASIARKYLGGEVRQLNNQIYYRMAGDDDEFAWHQDVIFRTPRSDYKNIESSYLQTIIVVDEIREDNGGIIFYPKSHQLGELPLLKGKNFRKFDPATPHPSLEGMERKVYEADPGDIMIWSVLTVHGSSANRTTRDRMTYMNGFAKAETVDYWPKYLENGHIVPLNPSLIP